jgi:transposase
MGSILVGSGNPLEQEMTMNTVFMGLDVHKETITIAVAEDGRQGEVRTYGTIENTPANVGKMMKRLATPGRQLHFCYEAGCCGYGLQRQIIAAGHDCTVVAPSLIPRKPGERVKTDRRDAMKLARLLRAGELDAVWVPDTAHEAMRDLVRSRSDAMEQLKKTKQQLQSFLLRHGLIYGGIKYWGRFHFHWLSNLKFDHAAHQIVFQDYINAIHDGEQRHAALVKQIEGLLPEWSMKPLVDALCIMKGINMIAATTILSTTGDLKRFPTPGKLSAYFGLVPAEHSSGDRVKRSGITKTGNAEARRILIQSAWCYRFPARVTKHKEKVCAETEKKIRDVAWRAQVRLCTRYRKLVAGGKRAPIACTAVARELTSFIWEMGQVVPLVS